MADSQSQQATNSQGMPAQLKPDDILKLQCLPDDEKQKYRIIMMNFYSMTQQNAKGTPEHTTADQKITEWSQKFILRERQYRQRMKMQQQQGNQGQPSQNSQAQGQSQGQVKQEPQPALQRTAEGVTAPQQAQAQPQGQQQAMAAQRQQASQIPQMGSGQSRPAAQAAPQPQIAPAILKHVQEFPIQLPLAGPAPGTPEYETKMKEYRNGYLNMLAKSASFTDNRRKIQHQIDERQKAGAEVPQELFAMKQRVEREYAQMQDQVDKFRKLQKQWKDERERKQAQQTQNQGQSGAQDQTQAPAQSPQQQQLPQQPQRQPSQPNMAVQPQIKEEPQIKLENGQVSQQQPAQQFNMPGNQQQQPPQNMQLPPSLQQQQQGRPPPAPHSQSMPPNQAQQFAQQHQQHPQQNRPQINPHQANAHQHQQSNSPHPQSATSNAPGPPVPLSHQAAVSAANRSYTDPQRTNTPLQQGGQGNFGSREREQLNNPKMPIPRHLNVTSPAPIHMGQARPTMSGPTNGAPGPMGQPVISRPPPFQLEGEGDRVLSKRKLDELVRQVTGGSEEALTSEVEEVNLSLSYLKVYVLIAR
jgi:hypothetical protein